MRKKLLQAIKKSKADKLQNPVSSLKAKIFWDILKQ